MTLPAPSIGEEARLAQALIAKATRFFVQLEAPLGTWGELSEFGMATVRPDYQIREILFGLHLPDWDTDALADLVTADDVIRAGLQADPATFPRRTHPRCAAGHRFGCRLDSQGTERGLGCGVTQAVSDLKVALQAEFPDVIFVPFIPSNISPPAIFVAPADADWMTLSTHRAIEERWDVVVAVSVKENEPGTDQARSLNLRIARTVLAHGAIWRAGSGLRISSSRHHSDRYLGQRDPLQISTRGELNA